MKNIFNTLDTKNKTILLIDIWLIITISVVWYILVSNNIKPTLISDSDCYWITHFGYYCPGCGGTRAFESILYGHIFKSLWYHPFVVYILSLILITFISFIVYFITKGNVLFFELKIQHLIYADFIFVVYWVFKNLLVFYFNYYIF